MSNFRKSSKLSEVADVVDCKHRTPKYSQDGVAIISPGNISWGPLKLKNCKRVTHDEYLNLMDHCRVQIGDIVFSRNQTFGVGSYVAKDEPFALGQDTVLIQAKDCQPKYLYYYLQSEDLQAQIYRLSGGSTFKRINLKDIRKLNISYPSSNEQRKIAEILSTWDEAIAKTEGLIAALQRRKKGLLQCLLTGEVRFVGFVDEWKRYKLGELLKPIARREKIDPNKNYSLIGVRLYVAGAHIHEIVPGDQIATKELSRIHENDIVYNKMWVTKNAFGIARKEHDGAYGSTEYPQFIPKPKKIDVNFLGFYFHDARFQYDAHRLCKGTTGRARLNPGDFLEIEVRIPKIEEQTKIADLLEACEQEIELLSKKLDVLKQQKKGLMQRLLTGQMRVKV